MPVHVQNINFMSSILIKSATIVNENRQFTGDVLIKNGFIEQIGSSLNIKADKEINAEGKHLLPGCIDDQVHHSATHGHPALWLDRDKDIRANSTGEMRPS